MADVAEELASSILDLMREVAYSAISDPTGEDPRSERKAYLAMKSAIEKALQSPRED